MVISLNDSEILSRAQGLTLPLNSEPYQLFAVIVWLSGGFLGHTHFPLADLSPRNILTFKHRTSRCCFARSLFSPPQFTRVSKRC